MLDDTSTDRPPSVIEVAASRWAVGAFWTMVALSLVTAVLTALVVVSGDFRWWHGAVLPDLIINTAVGAPGTEGSRIRFQDGRVRTRRRMSWLRSGTAWVDAARVHVRGPSARQIAAASSDCVDVGIAYGQRLVIDGDPRAIDDDSWSALADWFEDARSHDSRS